MRKFLFLVFVGCVCGFIHAPYSITERYAAAVANRDGTTIAELTDIAASRESLKESFRPVVAEYIRTQLPAGIDAQRANQAVLGGVLMAEKQIDLSFTKDTMQAFIDAAPEDQVSHYAFEQKGWRNPLTFIAVDNYDSTKMIFEFKGFDGWKQTRSESTKEAIRKAFLRGLQRK